MGSHRSFVDVGSLVAQKQFLAHVVLEIFDFDAVQALFESYLAHHEIGAVASVVVDNHTVVDKELCAVVAAQAELIDSLFWRIEECTEHIGEMVSSIVEIDAEIIGYALVKRF